jgi:hypothetical protein
VLRQQVRNPIQDATPKAGGKGMVDDFDVDVRNKNLDRTCLVDEFSISPLFSTSEFGFMPVV